MEEGFLTLPRLLSAAGLFLILVGAAMRSGTTPYRRTLHGRHIAGDELEGA
jgi:hypothetical protein